MFSIFFIYTVHPTLKIFVIAIKITLCVLCSLNPEFNTIITFYFSWPISSSIDSVLYSMKLFFIYQLSSCGIFHYFIQSLTIVFPSTLYAIISIFIKFVSFTGISFVNFCVVLSFFFKIALTC